MSYNMTDALLSSPDPLTDTLMFSSPTKRVRQSRARKSQQIHDSSPRKQTFELDVGNELSPQKIRVTVEAESNKENSYEASTRQTSPSPTRHYVPAKLPNTRTTTTTIPLRGLSDSENESSATPPKRGRGRPRKSTGTPIPAKPKTKNATLNGKSPRRRRTLGDLVDGDDEEDWDFEIGQNVEVGRGKGRSRSRSIKSSTRKKTTTANAAESLPHSLDSTSTTKKGRKQSLMPQEVPILEDLTEKSTPTETLIEDEMSNDRAPLQDIEQNAAGTHSEYSTIRSTTTAFGDSVTVAKFNLDKTPEVVGWSSPRVVSAIPSHFNNRLNCGSRSSPLAHQMVDEISQSYIATNEVVSSDSCSRQEDENNYHDKVEGDVGDLQEFDTILESEGFSMISVDSVPSLREQLSSPFAQSNLVESTYSSERQRTARENVDNFYPTLSVSSPSTETSSANNRGYDEPQSVHQDLTVASITNNSTKAQQRTINNWRDQDQGPDDSELLQKDSSVFHDSRLHDLLIPTTASSITETDHPVAACLPTPQETPSPQNNLIEISGREDSQEQIAPSTAIESDNMKTLANSSLDMPQMRSSPPLSAPLRYTYTAHLRQRRSLGLTETPSIVFSSPSLPPPKQRPTAREQLSTPTELNEVSKPQLSSSVIAGRALQEIVVPNSSSAHSSYLRSPFKSPNSRRHPLSPTEEPIEKEVSQASKLDSVVPGLGPISWRDLSRSRTLSGAALQNQNERRSRFMKNIPEFTDDPFLAGVSEQIRSPSPEEKQSYFLEVPTLSQARNSQISSPQTDNTDTVRHSDEMSWQAEYPSLRTPPRDDLEKQAVASSSCTAVAQTETQRQTRKDASVEDEVANITQHPVPDQTKVHVIPSDLPSIYSSSPKIQPQINPKEKSAGDIYDDDEDIWLAEARNSSSPLAGKFTEVASKQTVLEKPKRSKLPSPWRQNSRRLMYSDELAAQFSSSSGKKESSARVQPRETNITASPAPTELTVNAALLQRSNIDDGAVVDRSARPQLAPKAVLIPKSSLKGSELSHGQTQSKSLRQSIALSNQSPTPFITGKTQVQMPPFARNEEESDFSAVWNIPQKQNFRPRITPRQSNILGISALLESSPQKRPETANNSSLDTQETVDSTLTVGLPTTGIVMDASQKVEKVDFTPEEQSLPVSDEEWETTTEGYTQDVLASGRDIAQSPSTLYDISQLSQSESFEESSRLSVSPTHQNPYRRQRSASLLKSCIRTPSTSSPTKAVVFSATTALSPSSTTPRFMEGSDWEKCHWLRLQSIYWDYQKYPTPPSEIPQSVKESQYLNKMIYGKNPDGSKNMIMEEWLVDIVHMFLEEAEEQGMLWDEEFVCKRLYGLRIGEIVKAREEKEREEMKRREEAEETARKLAEEEAQKKKGILGLGFGWL